ncbi:hypothetical protein BsWGS_08933 [Bradybaena similaris]
MQLTKRVNLEMRSSIVLLVTYRKYGICALLQDSYLEDWITGSPLGEETESQVFPDGRRLYHRFSPRRGDWITVSALGEEIGSQFLPWEEIGSQVLPYEGRLYHRFSPM